MKTTLNEAEVVDAIIMYLQSKGMEPVCDDDGSYAVYVKRERGKSTFTVDVK